jgi:hypothetical protein
MTDLGVPRDGDAAAERLAAFRARGLLTIGLAATLGWVAVLTYVVLSHIFRVA